MKDFQRKIKDVKFKEKLSNLIQNGEIKKLFDDAIAVLSCKNNSLLVGHIPPIIIKQFVKKHQELFLFFLYWLHLNKVVRDEKTLLKMVSKLLLLAWFGVDSKNITHLWKEKIRKENFWNESLNELISWDGNDGKYGIHFLITPELLRKYYKQDEVVEMFIENKEHKWELLQEGVGAEITKFLNNKKSQEFDSSKANKCFQQFIKSIRTNKQLILFAQREYINSTFQDFNQLDDIEDTNAPWDWDHIYPDSWVYSMKNCEPVIRDWNGSTGNFRAISLDQNRRENNTVSPKDRLEDSEIRNYSFIIESDWEYWQKIEGRIMDKEKAKVHFRAITTRMINVYEKFWNDFNIEELLV